MVNHTSADHTHARESRSISRVAIFGVTGMVGQGVLRECLNDARVSHVLTVGRTVTSQSHKKLVERALPDLFDISAIANEMSSIDACFFCLGTSAAGMSEANYRRVTYDLTVAIAQVLSNANPRMVFIYVSGEGTDNTEQGGQMWARVKGATENAVRAMPFGAVFAFRPGFIQPLNGIVSRTPVYRAAYVLFGWLAPVLRLAIPDKMTDTQRVGLAMLIAARHGAPSWIVNTKAINALADNRGTA